VAFGLDYEKDQITLLGNYESPTFRCRRREQKSVSIPRLLPASDLERWVDSDGAEDSILLSVIIKRALTSLKLSS
jgi:hypothetical protein